MWTRKAPRPQQELRSGPIYQHLIQMISVVTGPSPTSFTISWQVKFYSWERSANRNRCKKYKVSSVGLSDFLEKCNNDFANKYIFIITVSLRHFSSSTTIYNVCNPFITFLFARSIATKNSSFNE